MAELVDAADLGSVVERCGGSSPSTRTTKYEMKILSNVLLITLPVLTGLGSVLWAKMVRVAPEIAMLSNLLGYSGVFLIFFISRRLGYVSPQYGPSDPYMWLVFPIATILTTLTSLNWIFSMNASSLPITAIIEIAYPIFILLFTAMLIERVTLNSYHIGGGLLLMIGAAFVLYGNVAKA